jgi:hypothetical protein
MVDLNILKKLRAKVNELGQILAGRDFFITFTTIENLIDELSKAIEDSNEGLEVVVVPEEPKTYSGFTEEQIQRIIDEGYQVSGSVYPDTPETPWPQGPFYKLEKYRKDSEQPFQAIDMLIRFKYIRLVREVGIRQPWFGGEYDGNPKDIVFVKYDPVYQAYHDSADYFDWDNVKEYILMEKSK